MSDASPPGLFFSGSDDDEPPIASTAKSLSSPPSSSPPSRILFLEDTDDDDSMYMSPKPSTLSEKVKRPMVIEEEDPGIQIMKPSQVSTKIKSDQHSRPTSLSPTLDKKTLSGPVVKKRRLLPPEDESPSNHATEFSPIYLGEVIISNAWSNVSGKGYVKQNEAVIVKREEQDLPQAGTSKPKPTAVQSGNKKQISIATMLKPQPAKSTKKKKKDHIVRLVNNNGSGDRCSSLPPSIL